MNVASVSSKEFREIIGHFASGVTVITTAHDGEWFGTTASAVSSLSLEPPMLLVCMNKDSSTGQAIAASGVYAVNILTEDQPDIATRFATKGEDKFTSVATREGEWGEPLIEDALATVECRVVEPVEGGTHVVFIAEVQHASAAEGAPLAYFRGGFGRLQLAADEVAEREVRALVRSLERGPEAELVVDSLARRFSISRGAIYHALVELTKEGLVRIGSGGTFQVVPLSVESAMETLRASLAIELGAAELSVARVTHEQLEELRAALGRSRPDASDEAFDLGTYISRYLQFHRTLVAFGGQALLDAYNRINAPMMVANVAPSKAPADRSRSLAAARAAFRNRARLVEAFEARDVAAARRAIQSNETASIEFITESLERREVEG